MTPLAAGLGQSALGGLGDRLLDPVTLDYVRTANGEWAETGDSRAMMLIQLETELGASPFFPADGTRVKGMLRRGEPVQPEVVLADALRAGEALVREGLISGLTGEIYDAKGELLRDEAGRPVYHLRWHDLAAGSLVDLMYTPGG